MKDRFGWKRWGEEERSRLARLVEVLVDLQSEQGKQDVLEKEAWPIAAPRVEWTVVTRKEAEAKLLCPARESLATVREEQQEKGGIAAGKNGKGAGSVEVTARRQGDKSAPSELYR